MASSLEQFAKWVAERHAQGIAPDTKEFDDFLDGLFCRECDRTTGLVCDKHDEEA